MSGLRGIPVTSLGASALRQLREMGVDVDALIRKAPKSDRKLIAPRAHKFGVLSSKEIRTFDGIVFDSKLELNTYRFLKDRRVVFEHQVPFELEPGFERNGKKYRPVIYVADFVLEPKGRRIVLDAKGFVTKMFQLKRKLMLQKHDIEIQSVKSTADLILLLNKYGIKRE